MSTAEIEALISKGSEISPKERARTFFSLLKPSYSSLSSAPFVIGFKKGIENLSVK